MNHTFWFDGCVIVPELDRKSENFYFILCWNHGLPEHPDLKAVDKVTVGGSPSRAFVLPLRYESVYFFVITCLTPTPWLTALVPS